MPGFDGRGPLGNGAMTGGGRGYCIVPLTRTNSSQQPTVSSYDAMLKSEYSGTGFFGRGNFFSGGFGSRRGGRRAISNRKFW